MSTRPVEHLEGMSKEELEKLGYSVNYFRDLLSTDTLRLQIGGPTRNVLRNAAEVLKKAANARLTEELEGDCDLLQYGDAQGDPTFRIQLAKFLTERYNSPVHSDDILCTAGASQGLQLLSTYFFKKGDLVFVEDPTYFLAIASFRYDQHLDVIGVSKDDDGIDTEELEKSLQDHLGDRLPGDTRQFRCALYLVHCFQNPTGTCTTPERSREIVRIARKYDTLVICDDVYNLLSWIPADVGSGRKYKCPSRLFVYDDPSDPDYKGNVVSCASVSKYLGPGLRLGWLEAPPSIINSVKKSQYMISGGSFNHLTGGFVGTMIKMGLLGPHLDFACDLFKSSVDTMNEALREGLPPQVKYGVPQGGYFFWLEFPKTVDIDELRKVCREKYKVDFAAGKNFSCRSNFTNCIRLSFSYYPEEQLREGCVRLCQAIREVMQSDAAAKDATKLA